MLLATLLFVYVVFVLFVDFGRTYIGYGETDFINFTIPEASRVLAGEPLLSLYHPPFYVLTVAGAKAVLGEWLAAGLAISLISGVISLFVSFTLLQKLAGSPAGWGAVIALLGSVVFMTESTRAATDLLFLALFLLSAWSAVVAMTERSPGAWLACGLFVGLALITRSNALSLLMLFAVPVLFGDRDFKKRAKHIFLMVFGFALPFLGLLLYASYSGSNILPVNNHMNLAMTYYAAGPDRGSVDAAIAVGDRFSGVFDLLLTDPVRIVSTYLYDLYHLISTDILFLIERPLLLLFLPGLFLLLRYHFSRPMALFLCLIGGQVLLVNFKPFEPRYYLFLIPLFGAAIGQTIWWITNISTIERSRKMIVAAIAIMAVGAIAMAALKTYKHTETLEEELAQILPQVDRSLTRSSAVVARKPHYAYHAGKEGLYLPNVASYDELRTYLDAPSLKLPKNFETFVDVSTQADTLYLLYGRNEKNSRPQFRALADPSKAPDWLEPVLISDRPGAWVLYRYRPSKTAS